MEAEESARRCFVKTGKRRKRRAKPLILSAGAGGATGFFSIESLNRVARSGTVGELIICVIFDTGVDNDKHLCSV